MSCCVAEHVGPQLLKRYACVARHPNGSIRRNAGFAPLPHGSRRHVFSVGKLFLPAVFFVNPCAEVTHDAKGKGWLAVWQEKKFTASCVFLLTQV